MLKGKAITLIAALSVLAGLIMIPAAVFADADSVSYLDADGTERTVTDDISPKDWPGDKPYPTLGGPDGGAYWYVLDSNVTYNDYRLTILGDVHLILKDGRTLNAKHGIRMAANNSAGASLTVYAQSTDKETMGKLIANASDEESCAGIGGNGQEAGGSVTINGGRIEAAGGKYGAGIGGGEDRDAGNIRINGGYVTATGGEYGAGIGGGEGGSGGDINIADGTVTAIGGKKAAGIGGGQKWSGGGSGGTIVIGRKTNSTTLNVTATAGNDGAGIGGGEDGEGGNITINSGTVTASGNTKGRGAGIGGGVDAHAGTITINGGDITANSDLSNGGIHSSACGGAGIGAGYDNDSGRKSKTAGGHIIINGGKIKANGACMDDGSGESGAGIGSGAHGYGCRIEIHGGDIYASCTNHTAAGIGGGFKGSGGVISIDNKVNDPTVYASTSRSSVRGYDIQYSIGDGTGYSGEKAEVTFDYPKGKVWIKWFFKTDDKGEGFVAADKRAQTVAAGDGSHYEIRIAPCKDHWNQVAKEVEGGHTLKCEYCSELDGKVFDHNFAWRHDDHEHWKVCLDCGAKEEVGLHTGGENDRCSKCGFIYRFKMNESELTLKEGAETDLQVITELGDQIQWSSESKPEGAVKVTGNDKTAKVEALKEGTAVITAKTETGLSAECNVTVKHEHHLTPVGSNIEPTCEQRGERVFYRCDSDTYAYGCDRTFFDEAGSDEFVMDKDFDTFTIYPPAFGHSWTEWEMVQPPTQREEGIMKRQCGFCGYVDMIKTVKADPTAIQDAISQVDDAKSGIASSEDGGDIEPSEKWATAAAFDALDKAELKAKRLERDMDSTQQQLNEGAEELLAAVQTFNGAVRNGTMGPPASEAEKEIMNGGEEGSAAAKYAPLKLRSVKQAKKSITLTWDKTSRASRYVIYGNAAGKKNKMKKLATVSGGAKSKAIKKAGKTLKKGKYYKFIIVGIDGNDRVVSISKVAHVATKGGKVGNYKSVTVKKAVVNKAGKLKVGGKLSLKAKAVKTSKKLKVTKRRALKYESDDTAVATVSSKGVITAKAAGTCYVYAYAQNGVFKKIKVTVQ